MRVNGRKDHAPFFQPLFKTVPLSLADWVFLFSMIPLVLLIEEFKGGHTATIAESSASVANQSSPTLRIIQMRRCLDFCHNAFRFDQLIHYPQTRTMALLDFAAISIPAVSFYVAHAALGRQVKLRAVLAGILGAFICLLWYAPSILLSLGIVNVSIVEIAQIFRQFFLTQVDPTLVGLVWVMLLPINLVTTLTGTKIQGLLGLRKLLTILFWGATAYVVWQTLAVSLTSALYALLFPLSITILTQGEGRDILV